MEEKGLFITSLICSLVGIMLIVLVTSNIEVPSFNISDLERDMLDQQVKLKGTIVSIRETDGLFILTLKDYTGTLPIVLFKPVQETFRKGTKVETIGKVSEFRKELQLTAKSVKTI